MEIKSTLTNRSGQVLDVVYRDMDSESDILNKKIKSVHAYCFYGDKLVLVYAKDKSYWTLPGGGVEAGESAHDAIIREIKEESNMKVLHHQFLGYQDVTEPHGIVSQTRSVCIVEPYGPFTGDPDGDITEIACVDPSDYKKYFNWGEVGDHLMQRALKIKAEIVK